MYNGYKCYYFKVTGTPRLCNSLLFGTTEYNNIVTTYHLQYIGNTTNNDDVIISYNITGLDPFNNYNFTVYITDYFNNTKDQDLIIFSELITLPSHYEPMLCITTTNSFFLSP